MIKDKLLGYLVDNLPHAIFWKDLNLVFQGCNAEFARQFGFKTPDEIVGKSDYDFPFSKDLIEAYRKDDKAIIASGISKINYEEIQTQPDRSEKVMLVSKIPYQDDTHKIVGIIGIYTDITDKKKQERELLTAKNYAESALQAIRKSEAQEQKHRKEAERLAIENATHKTELEAQAQFIRTIDKVAHDIDSPLGSLVTLTDHLGSLEEVSTVYGYGIALMAEKQRIKDVVYLDKNDTGLNFEVLGTDDTLKKGHITWDQIMDKLKSHFPEDAASVTLFQKPSLAILLDILIEKKLIQSGFN